MKICIIGASGKLGRYLVQPSLDRDHEVVGECRKRSTDKLDAYKRRMTILPGITNDGVVNRQAPTMLVPWGAQRYATRTAQTALDYAKPETRLIFSCGGHITRDGQDLYPRTLKALEQFARIFGRLTRTMDIDDQIEACRRVLASRARWTVVRGSVLEEGESQGLPVWSRHVGDPILANNITRRIDYALFMIEALTNDALIHKAPVIVGCRCSGKMRGRMKIQNLARRNRHRPGNVIPPYDLLRHNPNMNEVTEN